MKHLFVPYQLAKLAKEKGFNEPCFAYYWTDRQLLTYMKDTVLPTRYHTQEYFGEHSKGAITISAPLYQQLVDWFREKHKIIVEVQLDQTSDIKFCIEVYRFIHASQFERLNIAQETWGFYRNYTEALTAALIKAFELI